MANKGPAYGLSREVQSKIDKKYDGELEERLVAWIRAQCGEEVGGPEEGKTGFQNWLKDGCVLSHLINSLYGASKPIKKVASSKEVFKQMEQERRADLRADLQQRQAHTDRLMMMSGQPVKRHTPPGMRHESFSNASYRTEGLSRARREAPMRDVCSLIDFKGLIHVDNEHALEALMPGAGHELSVEFRAAATASAQPGWPAPPLPGTPQGLKQKGDREAKLQQEGTISKFSIPSSDQRMANLGARTDDETYKRHAKAQFLPTTAPPPPDQSKTLMEEDWSPTTTLQAPERVTGSFTRTGNFGSPCSGSSAQEALPPPRRSYVYPVMVPTSPDSKSHEGNGLGTTQSLRSLRSLSSPSLSRAMPSASSKGRSKRCSSTANLCKELDEFEAHEKSCRGPAIANFFGTPRATGSRAKDGSSRRL